MHFKRDNVRETDGATDGQSENASQAQKLLFPAGSFPSTKTAAPRSLSFVRPSTVFPSLLALARCLSSLPFHPFVRLSPPYPSIARPFAGCVSRPGEIYTHVRKASHPVSPPGPGWSKPGKTPRCVHQRLPTHRWKRNRNSDKFFAWLCRDSLFPSH